MLLFHFTFLPFCQKSAVCRQVKLYPRWIDFSTVAVVKFKVRDCDVFKSSLIVQDFKIVQASLSFCLFP